MVINRQREAKKDVIDTAKSTAKADLLAVAFLCLQELLSVIAAASRCGSVALDYRFAPATVEEPGSNKDVSRSA